MPSPPLPPNVLEFLGQPNHTVMATLAADGRPVTVATWYLLESDGTILLSLDAARTRLNHLRRDSRVAVTALDHNDWSTHVSVQGRVVSMVDDEGLHDIDRVAKHYIGQPYPNRLRPRVSVHVDIDRWYLWGHGDIEKESAMGPDQDPMPLSAS